MRKTEMTLTARRALTRDVFELRLSGDTSAIVRPGQFVNIALPEKFLRRPISVCDWEEGRLTLICRAAGEGTRALCESPVGTVFDLLTGLGNGYDAQKGGDSPILIGGGVGVPPLYALAKALIARGARPTVALGFNTASDCFYLDEFRALGCPVLLATADGTAGETGFVTALVERTDCSYCFCCGPKPMLRAVYGLPQLTGGQYSFEERMGCGFGACMGCSVRTRSGYKRVCAGGPIFYREEIVW